MEQNETSDNQRVSQRSGCSAQKNGTPCRRLYTKIRASLNGENLCNNPLRCYLAAMISTSSFHFGSSNWQQITVDAGLLSPIYFIRSLTLASSYDGSAK